MALLETLPPAVPGDARLVRVGAALGNEKEAPVGAPSSDKNAVVPLVSPPGVGVHDSPPEHEAAKVTTPEVAGVPLIPLNVMPGPAKSLPVSLTLESKGQPVGVGGGNVPEHMPPPSKPNRPRLEVRGTLEMVRPELLSTPTVIPSLPSKGVALPGSTLTEVDPSAFKTTRTPQVGDAPTAGHSVNGGLVAAAGAPVAGPVAARIAARVRIRQGGGGGCAGAPVMSARDSREVRTVMRDHPGRLTARRQHGGRRRGHGR